MNKITTICMTLLLSFLLTGCGERDVYDVMRENKQKEFERRQSMTQEERDTEDRAIKEAEEKAEEERLEKQEEQEKQAQWELENTDKIHYQVNRYSKDGKFVEAGKYTLTPASTNKLQTHNLENRGFDSSIDNKILLVDSSFFENGPPSGKFDIYYIVWEKGNREQAVRVGIAHRNVSRGW